MASISCPHCNQRISSPLIDVLEGGGELTGGGGLICASCGAKLRHAQIEEQYLKEKLATNARGSGCLGLLVAGVVLVWSALWQLAVRFS